MMHTFGREAKGYKGIGMEGFIARSYDKNARKLQMDVYRSYLSRIKRHLKDGNRILEIAPGPGYMAIELARLGHYSITGLDISRTFVEIARKNAEAARVRIEFEPGDVSNIPFPSNTFDFIYCTAAFKNFAQPVRALNEMHRVLKEDGKAWIDDLRHDISDDAIDVMVRDTMKASGMSAIFMRWSFRTFLRKSAYNRDELKSFIGMSAFRRFEITEKPAEFEVLLYK